MCGISGYLSRNHNAIEGVIRILSRLQNRGYDSAGIASIDTNKLFINKYISTETHNAIDLLNSDIYSEKKTDMAIGHTRWATHGSKTIENAHPHHDQSNRFAIVHNGIIENHQELRAKLIALGYVFYGQTDSEIIANYIDYLFVQNRDFSDLNTILHGSWAILIIDTNDPDKIMFIKNGSPLLIGFSEDKKKALLVSETNGFDNDISQYYVVADGTSGYLSFDTNACIIDSTNQNILIKPYELSETNTFFPFSHWTMKEIMDQPMAISKLLSEHLEQLHGKYHVKFPELENSQDILKKTNHIIFLACGTSYHAAQIGAIFFRKFNKEMTYNVIDGADFELDNIPSNLNTTLILLSQSGETKDLHRVINIANGHVSKTIGVVNVVNSLIAREVDHCLYIRAGRENAVASTKSFTNQVIMLLLMAIWYRNNIDDVITNDYIDALLKLPKDFENAITNSMAVMPKLLDIFSHHTNCFVLGKYIGEWISKEAALKIKEISYIHAEGYSASSLKHGPFALLSKDTPVILVSDINSYRTKIANVRSEIHSRYAPIIFISNDKNDQDTSLYLECDTCLFQLVVIIPMQILAYNLSVSKHINPDYPRNLAKVVTVE